MTIKSLNIKDQTTIHCHIISKPTVGAAAPSQSGLNSATTGANHGDTTLTSIINTSSSTTVTSTSSHLRQRLNNRTGGLARLQTSPIETSASTESSSANTAVAAATTVSTGQSNPVNVPSRGRRVLTSIDVNSLLLPLLAIVLAACWYFRINFKHFFSPLSTLVLIVLTFIYALFLFNNIHATSTLVANNFVITSRILQSRRRVGNVATEAAAQQPQTVTTQPTPAPE